MVGVKGRYRYTLVSSNGATTRRSFIECDSDHLTLTIGGLSNNEVPVAPSDVTFNLNIPVDGSVRGRNAAARWLLVQFIGPLPVGRSSRSAKVPIFSVARFLDWQVGASGTYLGLPVVVARKFEGRPTISGGSG